MIPLLLQGRMIEVSRGRKKEIEAAPEYVPTDDGRLYYACLLKTTPPNERKKDNIIGYCLDPRPDLFPGWRIVLFMGPLEKRACLQLCKVWIKNTRGFQTRVDKATFLSGSRNVPLHVNNQ